VTDLHLRILRMIAKHRQSALDDHDAAGRASAGRRRDLEKTVRRTKANVAAAQARRRHPRPGRAPVSPSARVGWR
jgi:hypothetical protein